MKNIIKFLARYRRFYGIFILVLFIWTAAPTILSISIGIPVMALGSLYRIWASGYIYKDNRLALEGPYSISRNPLYFGSYVMGAGAILAGWNPYMIAAYLISFPMIYVSLILTEEWNLIKIFGDDYTAYLTKVPRLIPQPWKYKKTDASWKFKLTFIDHKEYAAVLGITIAAAFLTLKMYSN